MKENTEIIIAMLDELLTISKSQHAPQSDSDTTINIDVTFIKALIEAVNRQNSECKEAKLTKSVQTNVDSLNTINNRIGGIRLREQLDFVDINQLLEQIIQKMDGASVRHNINESRHSLALEAGWDRAILIAIILLVDVLISTPYFESRPNYDSIYNDLKYRCIKLKSKASPESITELENLFELYPDNEKISRMRKDVETYEEVLRKQIVFAEQARFNDQTARGQENKTLPVKDKQVQSSKKSKT